MKTKTISFDIELAKKIQSGEVEGRIVCNSHPAEILSYEVNYGGKVYLCVSWINNVERCTASLFYQDGRSMESPELFHRLVLEVPDNEPQFKPFDKVLCRDNEGDMWKANLFSNYRQGVEYHYRVCGGNSYKQCIPYEGNEHLVGTTDKPKED